MGIWQQNVQSVFWFFLVKLHSVESKTGSLRPACVCGGGISWREQHERPGKCAVPMVQTPQWFSAQERGNVDEKRGPALVLNMTTERAPPPPHHRHHGVIECQAPRN